MKSLDSVLFAEIDGIEFALDFYSDTLEEAGWPLTEDRGELRNCLHEEMYRLMRKARKELLVQKRRAEQYLVPKTQEEYDRLLSFGQEKEMNVEFQNAINEYLTRCVPQILYSRLHKKLESVRNASYKTRTEKGCLNEKE